MTKFSEVAFVPVHCNGLIVCIVIARGYRPWNTANTTADIYLLAENSNKNIGTKCKVCSNFFSNHLAALRSTLGHIHGGKLSHHMLITTLFQVRPKVCQEPRIEVGSQSLTKASHSESNVLSHCVILTESMLKTTDRRLPSFFSRNYW